MKWRVENLIEVTFAIAKVFRAPPARPECAVAPNGRRATLSVSPPADTAVFRRRASFFFQISQISKKVVLDAEFVRPRAPARPGEMADGTERPRVVVLMGVRLVARGPWGEWLG